MKEKKRMQFFLLVVAYVMTIAGVVFGPCLILAGMMGLAADLCHFAGIRAELETFMFNPLLAVLCTAGGIGLVALSQFCQDYDLEE